MGKKPAKPIGGMKTRGPSLPGKATMYMAAGKGVGYECPTCGKKAQKAIVYEHQDVLYCSKGCVTKSI